MSRFSVRVVLFASAIGALLGMSAANAFAAETASGLNVRPIVLAAATDPDQKDAFDAAKELGTAEAWEAFLASFPDGFYADLARAYLVKLGNPAAPDGATAPDL